ncbi:MAG: transposase [Bacillota bacterium]
MPYTPAIHHRRSLRLQGYDYSRAGWYFITLCVQDRLRLFGEISNGEMILNDMGQIVSDCWLDLPNHYKNVVLDESVIMPNHFHGIVVFTVTVGAVGSVDRVDTAVDGDGNVCPDDFVGAIHESPLRESPLRESPLREPSVRKPSLQETTQRLNTSKQPYLSHRSRSTQPMDIQERRNMGLPKLVGRFKMVSSKQINIIRNTPGVPVWQRNYYEHIIRNEPELNRIREYIINNPLNWQKDDYND